MDDWEVARLALDAVRTAARIAEREQRRRQRQTPQPPTGSATQQRPAPNEPPPQRQPIFEMPASRDGDIPDEFLPKM